MKQILPLIALLVALAASAQDKVALATGDTIECKISGLNSTTIYAKTAAGRMKYSMDQVENYYYDGEWQVKDSASRGVESIMARKENWTPEAEFQNELHSAGAYLIGGTVIGALLMVAAIFVDDANVQQYLSLGGIVVFSGAIVLSGSKLQAASRAHKRIHP